MSTEARLSDDLLLPGAEDESSRRAFLKLTGFGVASAMFASCSRGPVQKVIPHIFAGEGVVAGRTYWLATTCHGCTASCGVLAKCRDGRPIKVEGNSSHGLSRGGLCPVGQADILGLYDSHRASSPTLDGVPVTWDDALGKLRSSLTTASGKKVRVLTGTIHSPSTRAWIDRLVSAHGGAAHVSYDPLSASAILQAHKLTHGVAALPAYRFDRAKVIASFDADFLGTWISPVQFATDYAAGRKPDGDHPRMSRHHHFEGRMSLTGGAADVRTRIAPHELRVTLAGLVEALENTLGKKPRAAGFLEQCRVRESVETLASELMATHGEALVVCGVNDGEAQLLVNYANHLVGSYGKTLSIARPSLQRQGNDRALAKLGRELAAGEVGVLIVSGVNPLYDLPTEMGEALQKAGTLVVHSAGLDETFAVATIGLPSSHSLESWDDGEPESGRFTLTQPAVPSLRNGRTLRAILAATLGDARADDQLLRDHWRNTPPLAIAGAGTDAFFDRVLHDGYIEQASGSASEPAFQLAAVKMPTLPEAPKGLALVLYAKSGLLDGSHAHNPWLQELPDPVTKVTWDNYASLSPSRAEKLGVELGDVVRIAVAGDGPALELPVLIQRGQHDDVVAVALGYGRKGTDRFSNVGPDWIEANATVDEGATIGVNAAPMLALHRGDVRSDLRDVEVTTTGQHIDLALTQDHHTLEVPAHLAPARGKVRHALQTAALADYVHDPEHALHHVHVPAGVDLWTDDHTPTRHHWGMAIDLSACTGCAGCVISCQAENNVPVVGKDEVRRHREMHWMRIDRYYSGDDDKVTAAHQPMFCQQCDNAPCEGVCPVLATVHSSEGLNQQVYNRCVGTRYCANTCPYKVRRFNWFDYPRQDELQNHSLNPDVTVRTRGVMEKCSFCAQRIQEAKSEAASEGRSLQDGDIRTACQQSCPTQAIAFGDLNDPESAVSKIRAKQRSYDVLAELNVKPSVRYLARIRNAQTEEEHHG